MKPDPSTSNLVRRRRTGLLIAVMGLFGLHLWLTRPLGRDDVANATIRALESRDARTLVRLTLTEEARKLNLSESNVLRFLEQTAWSAGRLSGLTIERIDQYPVDDVMFKVTSASGPAPLEFPMFFHVTQSPDGRWQLALGDLLRGSVYLVEGWKDRSAEQHERVARRYRAIADSTGIRGSRDNIHGYNLLSDPVRYRSTPQTDRNLQSGTAN